VDERRRGEAMGWYGSSMTAGTALGAPLVGVVIDARGASAGFLAAGVLGVLVCLAAIAAQTARRRQPARQAAAAE
jgi:predicted MFS family arabinose efflux permease